MTQITDLLREIRSAGITIEVTNDSRGVSPGGSMSLDLVRNHRCFATLSIKSFHETTARFENIDTYRITHLTIDNAEPINLRAPKTGQQLWIEIYALINDRHRRATALQRPDTSNANGPQRKRHRRRHGRQPQMSYSPAPPTTEAQPKPLPSQSDKFYRGHHSRRYKEKFRRFPDHYYQAAQ